MEQRRRNANWFELVFTLPARSRAFTTIGQATFDGVPAFEVRMVDSIDRVHHLFFDVESHLLLGVRLLEEGPLGTADISIRFGNWKPVGDLLLFHSVTIHQADISLVLRFDSGSRHLRASIQRNDRPMGETPCINITQVTKRFGDVTAVDDLTLSVPSGCLIGFLGPNGAGKSTTIRMIMSIIYADQGQIEVLGRTALDAKDRIGYLPEERGLYRRMRVKEFLRYIGRLKGLTRAEADRAAASWMDRLDLPEALTRRCEELSKGQQQKVQFAAAVLHDPNLIILDEPFSGLDPVNAALLSSVIQSLHEEGRTIVFSTHVLHQAEQLCDRIFLIDRGVKLLDDNLAAIRQRFRERIIEVKLDGGETLITPDGVSTVTTSPQHAVELHLDPMADERSVMRQVIETSSVQSIAIRQPSLEEIFTSLVAGAAAP